MDFFSPCTSIIDVFQLPPHLCYSWLVNRRYFLLALVVLAGCHSKPTEPPPEASPQSEVTPEAATSPAATTANADSRPVIVAFGDSLTAGYGADPGLSYPDFLQKELDARGFRYRVVNEGISGNTTKDGVDRVKDVLSLNPHVVIVAFGGNDGLRGLPIAATRANLDQILTALTGSGAKVVLGGITLPPNYGPEYIHQFNETYVLASRKFHSPLLPFLLKDVYGVPGSMQEDGIHATAQGNQQVARNLLPLVLPLLKKDHS
jgi:acyl-CoA thioesterase I